jgi:hypothetical protein
MSGRRSSSSEGTAESVAAGCSLREGPLLKRRPLDQDGLAVFTWGRGEDGQLGLGDTSDQDEPTYVDALRGVGIRQIACGSGHTVVLTTDGEVFTWRKWWRKGCVVLSFVTIYTHRTTHTHRNLLQATATMAGNTCPGGPSLWRVTL